MQRTIFPMLCVICVLAAVTLPMEAGRKGHPPMDRSTQPGPPIANRVLDLLDTDVVLDLETEEIVWESERFDTARFNKIGLRFSAETEHGLLTCAVCWQYDRDDEFLEGVPIVTRPVVPFQAVPGDLGRIPPDLTVPGPRVRQEQPDGIDDLTIQDPRQRYLVGVQYPYAVDFAEVRGLGAKVRCTMQVFQMLGDDRTDPQSLSQTVTLTDVKVLLRRE